MLVKEISTPETYLLRQRILRPDQPVEACHYPADSTAVHFGVFEGATLASVVTAHPENSPLCGGEGQWRIRGMATDSKYQSTGLGSAGLKALIAWGKAKELPLFWCNARERAIPFMNGTVSAWCRSSSISRASARIG